MICPTCKHTMVAVEYHNVELDYCNNCKGVWFDSGELDLLLKSQSLEEPQVFFDDILNSQEAVSSEKERKCPICGREMKKTAIGEQSRILIDVCRDRHGLWFDGGEVAQVMKHLAGERPSKHDARRQVISFLEEVFKAPEKTAGN